MLINASKKDFMGFILHEFVVNVKGSDLKQGITNTYAHPSEVDVLVDFYGPDPPIPFTVGTYHYLIFKQDNGDTDFSALDVSVLSLFDYSSIV